MLHWEYSDSVRRHELLRMLADQIDPLELFVLEASEETQESFSKLQTSKQFAYWLLRNDPEAYQMYRGFCVQRVLGQIMLKRKEANKG